VEIHVGRNILENDPSPVTLRDWLHANGVSQVAFRQRLQARTGVEIKAGTMNRWCKRPVDADYTIPQPAMVQAIRAETEGAVTGDSWYPRDLSLPLHKPRGRQAQVAA
jgi:hypothetical protein